MRHTLPALLVALLTLVLAPATRAHVPHDVADVVALSPDFANDQTVFAVFVLVDRRTYGRSTDGGRSWQLWGPAMSQKGVNGFAFSPEWVTDGTMWASTGTGGVFRSTNRGLTWTEINVGLTQSGTTGLVISPFFATDSTLVLATRTGCFRSTDAGDTWVPADTGLTETELEAIAISPPVGGQVRLFTGGQVVHRSDDLGLTWIPQQDFGGDIAALTVSPDFAIDSTVGAAVSGQGPLFSGDGGGSWAAATAGLPELATLDMGFTSTGAVFLTTNAGVFRADSVGGTWTTITAGLQSLDPNTQQHYRAIASSPSYAADDTVFLAAYEGFFWSTDAGATWEQANVFQQDLLYRLTRVTDPDGDPRVLLATSGSTLLSWKPQPAGLLAGSGPGAGAGRAPAASAGGSGAVGPAPTPGDGPPSMLFGQGWRIRGNGLDSLWSSGLAASPDYANDGTLFYCYIGAFRSTDRGKSWQQMLLGGVVVLRDVIVSPDYAKDQTVFLSTNDQGVLRSTDGGDSWEQLAGGMPLDTRGRTLAISPDFAIDGTVYLATRFSGVWRSTDGGDTWENASTGIVGNNIFSLVISPDFTNDGLLLASRRPGSLYRTTDGGDTWTPADTGLPGGANQVVQGIAFSPDFVSDGVVVATLADGGIYRSDDRGLTWTLREQLVGNMATDVLLRERADGSIEMLLAAAPGLCIADLDGDRPTRPIPMPVRTDDIHPHMSSSMDWSTLPGTDVLGTGVSQTSTAGAWKQLDALARQASCVAGRGPDAPIVELSVDGVPVALIDLYAPEPDAQAIVWTTDFGTPAWRTLRITHTGTANPSSTGQQLRFDGFLHTRE